MKQLIQLVNALADNMAGAERCLRQIARVIERDLDIEENAGKAVSSADKDKPQDVPVLTDCLPLEVPGNTFSDIPGTTFSVDTVGPEPHLIKKWADGKELWGEPVVPGSSMYICADNRYMLGHPSDATEELMERLQEDHGV